MIQRALLLTAVAAALQLHAATTYRVDVEASAPNELTRSATVTVSGDHIRLDYAPSAEPVSLDAQYSVDGGKKYIGINSGLKTWFPNTDLQFPPLTATMSGHLSSSGAKARKIQWAWREGPPGEPGTHTYFGTLSYILEEKMLSDSTTIPSRAAAEIEIRTTEAIDARWPGDLPLRTYIPELDTQLAASGAAIKGFPLRVSLISTQQYDRGPLLKDQRTLTVHDVTSVQSVDPQLFALPKGYREQPPLIAAPGVVSRQ